MLGVVMHYHLFDEVGNTDVRTKSFCPDCRSGTFHQLLTVPRTVWSYSNNNMITVVSLPV